MRLKTAYWTTAAMSTPALEHRFIDASIIHNFNDCAKVQIRLADGDGSMLQKYDSDAVGDAIYVGSGQALLYALDGTCRFNGRILAAERTGKILTLTCEDWMNQLKDERIHYDFREDLDGAGLRESTAHSDDDGAFVGPAQNSAGTYYFYDDDMVWGVDDYNGMNLVFTAGMAGAITVASGPYDKTVAPATDTDWDSPDLLWSNDLFPDYTADDDADFTVTYSFRMIVGHNTPSDLYVHGSITGARIRAIYNFTGDGINTAAGNTNALQIFADGAYRDIIPLEKTPYSSRIQTFEIPLGYVEDCVSATGIVLVRFNVDWAGVAGVDNIGLFVSYLWVEVDVETTGYASAVSITDTIANRLTVGTDLTAAASAIWEGIPYSICQKIYTHINGIVTAGDPLVTLTSSVESTAGISTYHASDKTRYEILKFVAPYDKAVFWIPLGTKEVNWKITTDAAATTLTDPEVLRWYKTRYDMGPMKNQAIIYGARIGDAEITQTVDAATSQLDYDVIRTEVVRNAGILSDYEAKAYGTTLTTQLAKIPLSVSAELAGFSSIRLGDWIEVTSNLLGITAGNYTVDRWEYSNDTTKIRLQPRGTDGYIQYREFKEEFQEQRSKINDTQLGQYLAPPTKQTW